MTQAERLARVEEQVKALTEKVDDNIAKTEKEFEGVNKKLDDLLALRNKGTGAFWLMSSLLGTGIVGFFINITDFIKGQ